MRGLQCAALALVATLGLAPTEVEAQSDYPNKGLTMVVPFPAGGRTDVIGRIIAQHATKHLGRPIAVVNKPGASSVLGSKEVAAAKADGYTLGFFSTAAVTAQYTVPTPIALSDYQLVAIVNADPAALAVQETAAWKSLPELVAHAKANPGKLRIGMIPGASAQIFAAGLTSAAGIDMIGVPFKGDTDGAIALAGGHIEVHVAVPVSYKSLLDAKKVRILAVAAEAKSPLYGNLPTFREGGVDLVIGAFHGIYLPKGAPADVAAKIADAMERTLASVELNASMNDVGAAVVFLKGAAAEAYLAKQDETYRGIIDKLGLRVAPAK